MTGRLSEKAYSDLEDLNGYIEAEANAKIGDAYDARIRAKIATLTDFPNRGTDQSSLVPDTVRSRSSGD